jgi:hypothetical protein
LEPQSTVSWIILERCCSISGTIDDYFRERIETVKQAIRDKSNEELIRTDTDKLTEFYVNEFELPTVKFDDSRKITYEQGKTVYTGWQSSIPTTIRYPIIPEENLEEVVKRQSRTFTLGSTEIKLEGAYLRMGIQISRSSASNLVESEIKKLEQIVKWKNDDVVKGNQLLRTEIKSFIDLQKKKVETDTAFIASVFEKVPVSIEKRTPSEILGLPVQVRKKIHFQMPAPQKLQEPDFPRGQFLDIVNTIRNTGDLFERAPKAYSKLDEEDLRDILLLGLNMMYMFDGVYATGETFNKTGHTDIFLRIPQGKNLVAECKIWKGQDYYSQGIDQLLGYLTWRANFGILITFCKTKDFSDVMAKAKTAAVAHSKFVPNSQHDLDKGHFVTEHYLLPDNKERKVETHHLLFYLDPKQTPGA